LTGDDWENVKYAYYSLVRIKEELRMMC